LSQLNETCIASSCWQNFKEVSFTDLGKEVKQYMDSGSFVPDDTMMSLIGEEIESVTDRNWLLDGE